MSHPIRLSRRRALSAARNRFTTLELLEHRTLLSTYHVTTTADGGAGSLRDAIAQANANAGADVIDFQIAGGGVQVINLASALPSVTDAVTIDGTTQSSGGVPQIELNGQGAFINGLQLQA